MARAEHRLGEAIRVYLLVDMHVPPGGYQGGTELGFALWDDEDKRARLKALWRELATRYKDEPVVAGWDLLNEPTPRRDHREQWRALAQELVAEIRSVDQNHLIVVEQALDTLDGKYALFTIDDDNVLYDFHFYYPDYYTIQYAFYIGQGDGGNYPNPNVSILPSQWVYADSSENPRVAFGDSDWAYHEGTLFQVSDARIVSSTPSFVCDVNRGTVLFDDFVVNEYDENQDFVRQIISVDIGYIEDFGALEDPIDPFVIAPELWEPWSADGGGRSSAAAEGHRGDSSLSISAVTSGYTLSAGTLTFAVRQSYHYQISGWMKGIGVTDESCQISLEFAQLPPDEDFVPFDRGYLESQLTALAEFGRTNNVPLNVGEFGVTAWGFENGKGGLAWVRDMLELFEQYGMHYQYWDYHSLDFGMYLSDEALPDPAAANQKLIELFAEA